MNEEDFIAKAEILSDVLHFMDKPGASLEKVRAFIKERRAWHLVALDSPGLSEEVTKEYIRDEIKIIQKLLEEIKKGINH